jgi:predicted GH43/DUF377 family glycosyl hydrolase
MKKSKYLVYILFLLLTGCNGCKPEAPTLTTLAVGDIKTDLTTISTTSGGNITDDGGEAVIARGVCWSTSVSPTTANSKTTDGIGSGKFASSLTGLSSGKTYYVRAYATNTAGTSYGDEQSFTTMGWAKYSGNPVMYPGSSTSWDKVTVGFGSVIYYNSKYHMWYTGGSTVDTTYRWKIGHATSDDGIAWTKDIKNPVLDRGPKGIWDDNIVHIPKVMVINNTFHMWYTGHKGTNGYRNFQIGHATSTDGSTWTKDVNNPVLAMGSAGTWDRSWVCIGDVLFTGTKYHMWYSGCDSARVGVKIGHATSTDGLTWTKDPANPVLVSLTSAEWDYSRIDYTSVLFDGSIYHMWYSGGSEPFKWKIGHATSTDGINWTKDPDNPVLSAGSSGEWDPNSVAVMSVLVSSDNKYKMWYSGSKTGVTTSVGYAEKPKE